MAINVKQSSPILFAKAGRRIAKPRLFGEPIQWVDTARYLGVILDTRLSFSIYIDQARKKAAQRVRTLGRLLNRRSGPFTRNGVLLHKQLVRPLFTTRAPSGGPPLDPISGKCWCFSLGVFALLPVHLST